MDVWFDLQIWFPNKSRSNYKKAKNNYSVSFGNSFELM